MGVGVKAEGGTRGGAVGGAESDERRQIETERDHPEAICGADPVVREQFAADDRRHRDQRVGAATKRSLGRRKRAGCPPAEIALEDVAVVRVHDPRRRLARNGGVVHDGRGAAEAAGFRHVRVNDRRPKARQQARDLNQRRRVGQRRNLAAQRRERCDLEPGGGRDEIPHVAFAPPDTAMNQQRMVTGGFQLCAQVDGLNRRTSDVQPRDDAGDPHRLWVRLHACHGRDTVLPPCGSRRLPREAAR